MGSMSKAHDFKLALTRVIVPIGGARGIQETCGQRAHRCAKWIVVLSIGAASQRPRSSRAPGLKLTSRMVRKMGAKVPTNSIGGYPPLAAPAASFTRDATVSTGVVGSFSKACVGVSNLIIALKSLTFASRQRINVSARAR
jgi:hypothetical protein